MPQIDPKVRWQPPHLAVSLFDGSELAKPYIPTTRLARDMVLETYRAIDKARRDSWRALLRSRNP